MKGTLGMTEPSDFKQTNGNFRSCDYAVIIMDQCYNLLDLRKKEKEEMTTMEY